MRCLPSYAALSRVLSVYADSLCFEYFANSKYNPEQTVIKIKIKTVQEYFKVDLACTIIIHSLPLS